MQVTNGTVTFRRQTKPADYESKTVEVSLGFGISEGEDFETVVAEVAAAAQRRAMVMLGLPEQAPVPGLVQAASKATRTTKPKEPILIGAKPADDPLALPATGADAANAAASPGAETTVASSADVLDLTSEMKEPAATDLPTAEADLYAPTPAAAPAAISEKDVLDAIGRRNAEIKNAVKIRELIGEFVQAPKTARDIPPERRTDFIKRLGELTA